VTTSPMTRWIARAATASRTRPAAARLRIGGRERERSRCWLMTSRLPRRERGAPGALPRVLGGAGGDRGGRPRDRGHSWALLSCAERDASLFRRPSIRSRAMRYRRIGRDIVPVTPARGSATSRTLDWAGWGVICRMIVLERQQLIGPRDKIQGPLILRWAARQRTGNDAAGRSNVGVCTVPSAKWPPPPTMWSDSTVPRETPLEPSKSDSYRT